MSAPAHGTSRAGDASPKAGAPAHGTSRAGDASPKAGASRVLAVDIGNTNVDVGVFQGSRLVRRAALPTDPSASARQWAARFARLGLPRRADRALVCSVVPRATAGVAGALKTLIQGRILVVGRDVQVPLRNRYADPGQVGQDRLVGAFAAWAAYHRACVIVDFGTAVTFDVVLPPGDYLGGLIAPGLDLSRRALAAHTALLPEVPLKAPRALLGRTTRESIRSGLIHGSAAMVDGLVERLKRAYAPSALVIAAGGSARLVSRYAASIDLTRPHLVLEGLRLLAARS
ncbi:MAG TPA: type III pantothenate kinase [bacterium]